MKLVLGIETSCDETSCAVVEEGKKVLSNLVSSSLEFHQRFGGIIPEAASRYHLEYILPLLDEAVKKAGVDFKDLDFVAVTYGPGLSGALMVGINVAKAISFSLGVPLIPVNHILAHLYASFLVKEPRLPAIGLVVSGGHTELYYIREFNDLELLGKTRDDACGEAFDKVAKILGLGFPGGPLIEKWAKKGKQKIPFKCAKLKNSLDFSFSGIKTAVLYYVKKKMANSNHPSERKSGLMENEISDLCASFQEIVFEVLVEKARQACIMKRVRSLILGGGVSANSLLRERMETMAKKEAIEVFFPPPELSVDNAAMVAGLGYRLSKLEKIKSDYSLEPKPVLEI